MRIIANLMYKVLHPFIEIEWAEEIGDYKWVVRIILLGKIVSEVYYVPDIKSFRSRIIRED